MSALRTEVLVVGSGAGGSLTAATLAEAGLDVTVLEEGPWVDPSTHEPFSRDEMVAKYRHRGVNATVGLPPIAYVEGRCVGGGTEVNSGLYHRPPADVVEAWAERYGIVDLDPDSLHEHSARIEKELCVSPVPGPLPATNRPLADGAARLGWDAREVPRWFRYPEGGGSHRDGEKQTMTRTFVPRAVAAGATLLPGCRVERLVMKGGRCVGARVRRTVDGGRTSLVRVEAEHVFVCAGAIQTPALLQRSGLRKGVGAGLKVHPTIKLLARFPDEIDDHDVVPMHQVKEFAPDLTFGGSISRPGYLALAMASRGDGLEDVRDWRHVGAYYAAIRSDGSGRVLAVPGLRDPIVGYRLTDADLSRLARGAVALGELLFAAGATEVRPSIAGAPAVTSPAGLVDLWDRVAATSVDLMTIHLFSTIRMGERRDLAAADSFGRVHGVANLHVHDASLLPDAPGVNPQGTILAVAARGCERFLAAR